MRGRPPTFNNEQVIKKAQKVFWEKGFTATSLGNLLSSMDMGSGSFYNAFKGGKKEVFRKALRERKKDFNRFKTELEQSHSPVELIKDFFRSLADAEENSHLQGCIIANTVVEMTFVDKELENEAVEILKDVERMYTQIIREAQEKGTIENHTDPEILGRYLITLYNGLNVLRRMYPDKEILEQQIELQLQIIN